MGIFQCGGEIYLITYQPPLIKYRKSKVNIYRNCDFVSNKSIKFLFIFASIIQLGKVNVI